MTTAKTCPVSPWTVLMAIRYGLGRGTPAHYDALALIREFWTVFDAAERRTIIADLDWHVNTKTGWDDVRASSARMLEWCREVETADAEQAQR